MLKKLTGTYGEFVMDAAIAMALILLILFIPAGNGRFGVRNLLSGNIESGGVDYFAYADSGAVANVLGKPKPVIAYHPYDASGAKMGIVAGKDVALVAYFKCTDADGAEVQDVKVTSITDKSGTELLADRITGTETFRFPSCGTYEVEVTATDGTNQYSIKKISIPVTGKRQGV